MRNAKATGLIVSCVLLAASSGILAQDWPQWRGPNRDGKAAGFKAPDTWPKELTKKWSVKIGDGVATPSLVGDKLYVFSREGGNEIIRCLNAADGKEQWQDKYETGPATGAAASFAGPRCSPTVADGKVVVLGVQGILSCYDAAGGKLLWRKNDFKGNVPSFFASSSPIVVDGLCIAQLGGGDRRGTGAIVAYNLSDGAEKWKWGEDGTAYASPVLQVVDGTKMIVATAAKSIVGIGVADGKLLWHTPFELVGMGYNACTPIVDGATVIFSGTSRGTKAVKIVKQGDSFAVKELWTNKENSVQFNSPVVKESAVFGITGANKLFCISTDGGKTAWTADGPTAAPMPQPGGGGKKKGGGGGRGGYGSVVDAGSVLFGLTPAGKLVVYQSNAKEYKELASYKIADGFTYAYPVISGNRIFIKDRDNVTLWTVE